MKVFDLPFCTPEYPDFSNKSEHMYGSKEQKRMIRELETKFREVRLKKMGIFSLENKRVRRTVIALSQ